MDSIHKHAHIKIHNVSLPRKGEGIYIRDPGTAEGFSGRMATGVDFLVVD
jgi:hypothetical protein